MSFLRYMISNDYTRFRDVEALEQQAQKLDVVAHGADMRVQSLAATVGQLAATVRVLTRTLAEAGLLDLAKIEVAIKEELHHPGSSGDPDAQGQCVRCSSKGLARDLVKVGADLWCRSCARNP
jgi:hypothetical protein